MSKIGFKTTFDAAHRLARHAGKCKNLHGHTYGFEIVLSGLKGPGGMLLDFGVVKAKLSHVLVAWDHAVVLEKTDPLLKLLRGSGLDLCIVEMENEPTVENMVDLLAAECRKEFAALAIEVVSIRVYETPTCWAEL